LVIDPPSGAPTDTFAFELVDGPKDADFSLSCDGKDQSALLGSMISSNKATVEATEFRTRVSVPFDALLSACPLPTRMGVVASKGATKEAARTTYRPLPPECSFAPSTRKILLTGFEPFPADHTGDNVSERAVLGFNPGALENVSVMKLLLPVEYDTAASWVADVVQRCTPDVVVSFGQGRLGVDIETTAYNRKDTSDVPGGVPDNRGSIYGGESILPDGPEQYHTALPAETIVSDLVDLGFEASTSDDPGRYVCNNVFYTVMHTLRGTPGVGGFVHLPYMTRVDSTAQAKLDSIVKVAVQRALEERARH
jgi:pyroglutamyl-peptidase